VESPDDDINQILTKYMPNSLTDCYKCSYTKAGALIFKSNSYSKLYENIIPPDFLFVIDENMSWKRSNEPTFVAYFKSYYKLTAIINNINNVHFTCYLLNPSIINDKMEKIVLPGWHFYDDLIGVISEINSKNDELISKSNNYIFLFERDTKQC
jgi:hypothetical protein